MYPEMLYDGEKPKDPVTFDIYPEGNTSFEMYEDDGLTREYKNGAFAKTLIEVNASDKETVVTVNPAKGEYKDMPVSRKYVVQIHRLTAPKKVYLNGKKIKASKTKEEFMTADQGWYFDPSDRKGVVHIKTLPLELKKGFEVKVK